MIHKKAPEREGGEQGADAGFGETHGAGNVWASTRPAGTPSSARTLAPADGQASRAVWVGAPSPEPRLRALSLGRRWRGSQGSPV